MRLRTEGDQSRVIHSTKTAPVLRTVFLIAAALMLPVPAIAQNVPPVVEGNAVQDTALAETVDRFAERPTPRGAFLRSMVVPGWGQAAAGSYSRAVFYAIADITSGTMMYKSHRFLESARESEVLRLADAERKAARAGIVEPDSILAFVDEDEAVVEARGLVEARSQQREDWIAFGLFMLFLGGADAFVSAHLSDFPDPLTVNPVPSESGPPGIEIGVRLPAPWGGPPRR